MTNLDPLHHDRGSFQASEIFRLRQGQVQDCLKKPKAGTPTEYRVAVILPESMFSAEDYELLETGGILVIEVPSEVFHSSAPNIADYLNAELNAGAIATAARLDAVGSAYSPSTSLAEGVLPISENQQRDYLTIVNNPTSDLSSLC